ncbi:MAG: DUF1801 domain-containing protein [Urechidicola sp.]|nr:DUF1801 domain-containing protein [Urechidicola sp.]
MNPVENYFLNQKEPYQSLMLYIRGVIKRTLPTIEEKYSYGIPFYHLEKKPLIYLNVLKGTDFLDIAFVQGIKLQEEFPELKDYKNRKNVRSIQVKNMEDFDELQFVVLLNAAGELSLKSKSTWNP